MEALLQKPAGQGTAVVVNESGEIGIDHAVLTPAAAGRVALLGGGCLCCVVRTDLETTFRVLLTDRARGAVPPFERVVLELSGADDPTPVSQTFLSDRALGREYHLQAVVVDAATGADALGTAPEARRQVAVADRVVFSKGDLAPPGAASALEERVRALNPQAPIAAAENGRVAPDFLLAPSELPPASLFAAEAAGRAHTRDLATFSLLFEHPFARRTLTAALGLLCELRGADLLRAKGLVAVEGCRGPVVVHAVRHVLHPPAELEAWPDPGDRRSRLVFVTRGGLARGQVLDLFHAVTALAPPEKAPSP